MSAVVTPQPDGSFLYAYTVSVDPASTVGAAEFDMAVDPGANLDPSTFLEPTGFLALDTPGDSYVQFLGPTPRPICAGDLGHVLLPERLFRDAPARPPPRLRCLGRLVPGRRLRPGAGARAVVGRRLGLGVAAAIGLGIRRRGPAGPSPGLRRLVLTVAASLSMMAFLPGSSRASDHADTAENVNRIGADLTDLYIFPNPSDASRVVLVMDSHGLIPAGQGAKVGFDPQVLYQFKIDRNGDHVEDLVSSSGSWARPRISRSSSRDRRSRRCRYDLDLRSSVREGRHHQSARLLPDAGLNVFAGVRSEPFFLDLNRFYQILPDRATPLTGMQVNLAMPNTPQINGFRGFPPGSGFDSSPAFDYLKNLNVMSIVVEMPKTMLGGGVIGVWMTTSVANGSPASSTASKTASPGPSSTKRWPPSAISATRSTTRTGRSTTRTSSERRLRFMKYPAGRSDAIANTLVAVLVPDVMTADLSRIRTSAAYLGVETGGASGSKFGGRASPTTSSTRR